MRINYGLMPGDKLTVADAFVDPITLDIVRRERKCTVVKEYPFFIDADYGAYRESINKANIRCGDVLVWKGWEKDEA